jgi:hypothetical protein
MRLTKRKGGQFQYRPYSVIAEYSWATKRDKEKNKRNISAVYPRKFRRYELKAGLKAFKNLHEKVAQRTYFSIEEFNRK